MYMMVFKEFPFDGEDFQKRICKDELKFPKHRGCSEDCKDFIRSMLEKDKEKRAKIVDLKMTKWFLLADSALKMKEDLARQNHVRTLEEDKEKEEQAYIKKLL